MSVPVYASSVTRVLSLNLCTDQLLLQLLPSSEKGIQIVGLSPLARRCAESAFCQQAQSLPRVRPEPEAVLGAQPTLLLDGLWGHAFLSRLDGAFKTVRFPEINTLAGIGAQLEQGGNVLGEQARGKALAAAFQTELAALRLPPAAPVYTVAVWGEDVSPFLKDVLEAAGLHLLPWHQPEEFLHHPPDLLVQPVLGEGVSLKEKLPYVLQMRFSPEQRLVLPERWLLCPTPKSLQALRLLLAARQKLGTAKP